MALSPVSDIAIQQFRDVYLETIQRKEKLADTSMEIHGVVGDAYKWPKIGNAEMSDRGSYQSIVGVTPLDHTEIVTNFQDKVLRTAIDRGEETLINASERAMWAGIHAGAYGRRLDQWKYDALALASTNVIANGGTNLTLDKLIEANGDLIDAGFEGPFIFTWTVSQRNALLKSTIVTSSDYATVKALVNGEINSYLNFEFKVIPDLNTVAKLPKVGNIRTCYAWSREALGSVYKMEPNVNLWYSDNHLSWLADSRVIGGSSILYDAGVVKIDCDETA